MSINLDIKQILNTVSEMVVSSPKDAKDIFKIINDNNLSNRFEDIQSVIDMVNKHSELHPSDEYFKQLEVAINLIENDDIKAIFEYSLKSRSF
ncbi:hypothetical protein [Vibrio harveyi]|uniref:hypothetical protein n=1 Tax=Vibrio harveyi TaxID=669 RepID=UPI00069D5109|nr:hypothetical protein [Vibrio harveyi]KNY38409.1 hypothetical protein AKG93_25160 [Vibrio harveyi]